MPEIDLFGFSQFLQNWHRQRYNPTDLIFPWISATRDFCQDLSQARDTFVNKNIALSETDRDLPKHVKNGFMRYRDFQPLTQGGEAILRTCVDENLGRVVVMKTLQPQFQNLETYQKRFLREARVTAQIPHPATIPVYELSRDSEGNAYFTMKKLGGRDMSDILDQLSDRPRRSAKTISAPTSTTKPNSGMKIFTADSPARCSRSAARWAACTTPSR